MKTVDNGALLASYVLENSEAAFRELVERYIDLVYSTAVRLAGGNAHFAADVAQTVFIDLARKACGLSSQVMLGGWLHRRTCNVAATMLRSERRRQAREREAMAMNTQQDHTQTNWARVAPILDEAIQAAALHKTLDEMFQELIKNEKDGAANEAGSQRETLNCLGLGTVTSTNGQPVSLNCAVAIYGDTRSGVGLHDNGGSGNPIRVRNSDDKVLDLGPYSGPPITVTPVILSDRNSIDLSLQTTIFKRFDDTP